MGELRPEQADNLRKEYTERFDELLDEVQEKLGTLEAAEMVNHLVSQAQTALTNTVTIEEKAHEWLDNIRYNYDLRPHEREDSIADLKQEMRKRYGEEFNAVVIGAGPTVCLVSVAQLMNFDGAVICTNKSLKTVTEGLGRAPDICVVLDSDISVLKSVVEGMEATSSDENCKRVHFFVSSAVHRSVMERLRSFRIYNLHMFHASMPEDYMANVDYMCKLFWDLPVIDTGGNAGLLALYLAHQIGAQTTGVLGLEHTHELDSKWTNEQAFQYKIVYAPEDDQTFAITPSFQGYLMRMVEWSRSHHVVNLSEWGWPYVMRNKIPMEYMDRKEFVKNYGPEREERED